MIEKITIHTILSQDGIIASLNKAWLESSPNFARGHEEGGFILVDDSGRFSVSRWFSGGTNEISLPPHENCQIDGKPIIASFHTHPNTGNDFQQDPSLTDIRAVRDDPDLS